MSTPYIAILTSMGIPEKMLAEQLNTILPDIDDSIFHEGEYKPIKSLRILQSLLEEIPSWPEDKLCKENIKIVNGCINISDTNLKELLLKQKR